MNNMVFIAKARQRSRDRALPVVANRRNGARTLLSIAAVVSSVMIVLMVRQWLLGLTAIDVARVVVTGDLQYVDRVALVEEVKPLLREGYLFVDLEAVRNRVIQLPWVFDAVVSRRWPDQIQLAITEQKPIARWSDKGYLNQRGEFFPSPMYAAFTQLPLLSGTDQQQHQVIKHFRDLSAALRNIDLQLSALSVDQRGDWRVQLNNRITLELGTDLLMEKMQRFIRAHDTVLADKMSTVAHVDLRYNRGFAVSWNREVATQ